MSLSRKDRIISELRVQKTNDATKRTARILLDGAFKGEFPLRLRCECGRDSCDNLVEIPATIGWSQEQYKPQFVVWPGHEQTDIEDVVERHDNYFVVRKALGGLTA